MVAPFKPRLMPVPAADRPKAVRLAISGAEWPIIENGLAWLKNLGILNDTQVAGFPELASRAAREMSRAAGRPVLSRLNEEIRESMLRGEGAVEWRQRLAEIADVQAHLAETIQRTATHRAYHEGLDEIVKSPGLEDAFPFWEYHATGDNRTRPEHQEMDGKVFHRDSPMAFHAKQLVSDWNCRCTMIPISREDAEAAGIEPGQGGPIGQEGKDTDVEDETAIDRETRRQAEEFKRTDVIDLLHGDQKNLQGNKDIVLTTSSQDDIINVSSGRNVKPEEITVNELKGSEKQIAWAEKIRSTKIKQVEFAIEKNAESWEKEKSGKFYDAEAEKFYQDYAEKMKVLLNKLLGQDSAKWWIDNKDSTISGLDKFRL